MQAKEKYQHNHLIEHGGIKYVRDIPRHLRVEDDENGTMQAKEKSHMADIWQHYRVGGSNVIGIGDSSTSSANSI